MRFASLIGCATILLASTVASAEYNVFGGPSYYSVGPTNATFTSIEEAMQSSLVNDGDVLWVASGDYLGESAITKAVTIEIGSSPGLIEVVGSMFVSEGATINFELFGTGAGEFDQLFVAGALYLQGEVKVSLGGSFMPSLGDSFKIADTYGIVYFESTTYSLPPLAEGLSWQVTIVQGTTWNGVNGEQLWLTVVPTPGAIALLGLAGVLGGRRRRV